MRVAILLLTCTLWAQKIDPNTKALPQDVTKEYQITAEQQKLLAADWSAHEKCMAQKDPEKRNLCFHPTRHKWYVDCQKIISDNKLPATAICSAGIVKGKDAK